MNIKIENYLLEQEPLAPGRFNIKKIGVKKKGEHVGGKTENVIAYGVPLERCVNIIAHAELNENTDTVDLRTFIDAYRSICQRLEAMIYNANLYKI